jgi:hypothetical protein
MTMPRPKNAVRIPHPRSGVPGCATARHSSQADDGELTTDTAPADAQRDLAAPRTAAPRQAPQRPAGGEQNLEDGEAGPENRGHDGRHLNHLRHGKSGRTPS